MTPFQLRGAAVPGALSRLRDALGAMMSRLLPENERLPAAPDRSRSLPLTAGTLDRGDTLPRAAAPAAPERLHAQPLPTSTPGDNVADRLAALVAWSDDAIVGKDLDGTITSWNRAAEEMFGYTAQEAVGRHIGLIVPDDRLAEEAHVLTRVRSGTSISHYETRRRRKDGTFIDIDLAVSPIRSADGAVIGTSKVARNITEQKRLRQAADDTCRMKDEFLAVFSHELRTPLNNVLGNVKLLRKETGAEHRERALDSLERNALALARLVNDVLETSRIITGQLHLSLDLIDAAEVVRQAIDTIRPAFDAKGVAIVSTVPTGLHVRGDRERLEQVVWHVLSNAVKFTAPGERVTVLAAKGGGNISITVEDTGIGIAAAQLPHVFQRFWQSDSTFTRDYGGLGIGLALVQHVVELHGGQVEAASAGLGRGTAITIALPAANVAQGFVG
jgi:PAS domain S-box-containing protein